MLRHGGVDRREGTRVVLVANGSSPLAAGIFEARRDRGDSFNPLLSAASVSDLVRSTPARRKRAGSPHGGLRSCLADASVRVSTTLRRSTRSGLVEIGSKWRSEGPRPRAAPPGAPPPARRRDHPVVRG